MAYAPAADTALFTRRGAVFLAIIGIHVGMVFLLYTGMSRRLVDAVLGPIETRIIEEAPEEEDKPPPPPPKLEAPPPPFVPPPDISIEMPVEAPTNAITNVTNVAPVAPRPTVAAPAPPKPVTTAPKSDPRRPLTQPEYPPSSRRAGEAGTVVLEVYVLETGKVGDARVKESSGFPKLDEAALREVKRSWRLVPGTENGKAVAMWGQFAVTFKLTD
jgi:protein TonB